MSVLSRQAPAVRYPFAPSRQVARLLCLLSAAGAVVLAAWLLQQRVSAAQMGAGGLLWTGCSFGAWRWWRAIVSGELIWNGTRWSLRIDAQDEAPCPPPRVCGDLQSVVWARLDGDGGMARWLWLAREADPAHWLDLRRALFAAHPRTEHPAAQVATGAVT